MEYAIAIDIVLTEVWKVPIFKHFWEKRFLCESWLKDSKGQALLAPFQNRDKPILRYHMDSWLDQFY